MGLIQRVKLQLDQASVKALTAEMGKAGKESGAALEKDVGGAMDRLKGMAATVGSAIATAFAVQKIIAFGKSVVMAAIESEAPWARLAQTLKGIGIDLDAVRGDVDKVVESLKATRFDDEAIAETLGSLVQMSGDYGRSLGAVSVVADLAAAKHLDLDTAAMLVGKAMNGNTELLSRYGIFLAKGADGLEALRQQFRGFSEAEGKTHAGQIEIATNAWGDFQEALGGVLLDAGDGISIVDSLTRSLRWMTEQVELLNLTFNATKEMQLDAVQKRIAAYVGRRDSSPTFGEGGITTVGAERARLLATEKELTAELNAQAKAHTAALRASREAADAAAKAAAARRAAEAPAAPMSARDAAFMAAQRSLSDAADRAPEMPAPRWMSGGFAGPKMPTVAGPPSAFGPTDQIALSASIGENIAAGMAALELETSRFSGGTVEQLEMIRTVSADVAGSMTDLFTAAFGQLLRDGGNVKAFFSTLGQGLAKSILGEIASIAKGKAKENLAYAIEALAHGIMAATRLDPRAAGFFASAKTFGLAAAGWGAAAGSVGALAGGGSEGGYSRVGATGAGNAGGGLVENATRIGGGTFNIHIDGVDPRNPVHADLVGETYEQYRERYGGNMYVNGRRVG